MATGVARASGGTGPPHAIRVANGVAGPHGVAAHMFLRGDALACRRRFPGARTEKSYAHQTLQVQTPSNSLIFTFR